MLTLIGSRALRVWTPFTRAADLDFIATIDEINSYVTDRRSWFKSIVPVKAGTRIIALGEPGVTVPHEFEIAWPGSNQAMFLDLVSRDPESRTIVLDGPSNLHRCMVRVPSPSALYALKMSHRFLKDSPHFLKTMRDIQFMRREFGFTAISDYYRDWFKRREKDTYNYSHPNLSQTKMGFFSGDGVRYVYDHDSIHVAMARQERPAYTYFQKDGAQVQVDQQKWEALPHDIKISSVIEESYVLALERSQIPFPGVLTPEQSFLRALMKVCTSITSGWWRAFAWEHYDEARAGYDLKYVDRFWGAVETGTVKKIRTDT